MIHIGDERRAKYWGRFKVRDIVKLPRPVKCFDKERGNSLFNPTLIKIAWQNPPSRDNHELWFPYWITVGGKERYGRFAPMMGERTLLQLLTKAIKQGLFSTHFLLELNKATGEVISSD